MKVKLNKILNSVNAVNALAKQTTNAKVAFKLAKILNVLSVEVEAFEKTKSQYIQNRLSEEKPELNEQDKTEITKELMELISEEVSLSIDPISINDVGNIVITVQDMMTMDFLFKE